MKLLEEVDSDKLSLASLKEKGLKAAPQGPIKLKPDIEKYISEIFSTEDDKYFPDTIMEEGGVYEGFKKQVSVNKYERSTIARAKYLDAHGHTCKVCEVNFEEVYGAVGIGFIHVHHIVPLHTIGKSYKIDYINDLVPVCPNCHAMLHREIDGKYYTVSELAEIVQSKRA